MNLSKECIRGLLPKITAQVIPQLGADALLPVGRIHDDVDVILTGFHTGIVAGKVKTDHRAFVVDRHRVTQNSLWHIDIVFIEQILGRGRLKRIRREQFRNAWEILQWIGKADTVDYLVGK